MKKKRAQLDNVTRAIKCEAISSAPLSSLTNYKSCRAMKGSSRIVKTFFIKFYKQRALTFAAPNIKAMRIFRKLQRETELRYGEMEKMSCFSICGAIARGNEELSNFFTTMLFTRRKGIVHLAFREFHLMV